MEIKRLSQAKFLGVTVDENLNWNAYLKKVNKNGHATCRHIKCYGGQYSR